MPKQAECEQAIRHLAREWIGEHPQEKDYPNFYAFKKWCEQKGYGSYFNFKSQHKEYYAEMWFDQELGLGWR